MSETVNVATIVGARPQFIKASAVSRSVAQHNSKSPEYMLVEKIIHTGQHYDDNMSKAFLAGALAAVKLQIPVAHVEAGLRSFNRRMAEEINRVLTEQGPKR